MISFGYATFLYSRIVLDGELEKRNGERLQKSVAIATIGLITPPLPSLVVIRSHWEGLFNGLTYFLHPTALLYVYIYYLYIWGRLP